MTKNIGRNEVIDKPTEFMEGIRGIYGEAGSVVFEYKLTREIRREFGIAGSLDKEPTKGRTFAELVRLVAYAALG